MLYTLVILACLTDAPQLCERREQIVEGLSMHPGTAFMQAQRLVAQWMEAHSATSCKAGAYYPVEGHDDLPPEQVLPAGDGPNGSLLKCHHHKLRPVALFLRTTSLPYANLSQSQSVNTARKIHFEVERQGL